ncbi:hypothetical protein GUJ93_ZPchr0001g30041 [Zizania palustris]|uniref:BHLH domain-containing protein n=1 Tax=Zizania palustris TaxID=103762 RepID=A0A8J5RZP1_ZIZPA|nr:hypothetical protein GUJ93_ZPchr0001g30041 [Zizania palustris]
MRDMAMDNDDDYPFYFVEDAAAVVDDEELLVSLGFLLPPPVVAPAEVVQQQEQHQLAGSAFAAYRSTAVASLSSPEGLNRRSYSSSGGGGANLHRRMHEYLRSLDEYAAAATVETQPAAAQGEPAVGHDQLAPRGGSARFRHIMRERLRRERLSQGYAELHAILPGAGASKVGKNFIVAAAASYIRELEGRKWWLSARNEELERAAAPPTPGGSGMVVKVRAAGSERRSMVDVFEVVLRRLKAMEELRVTAIHSCLDAGGMRMDIAVESEISSREVDKAITNTLMEMESGCLQDPISSSKSSFSCQVESGVLLMS